MAARSSEPPHYRGTSHGRQCHLERLAFAHVALEREQHIFRDARRDDLLGERRRSGAAGNIRKASG